MAGKLHGYRVTVLGGERRFTILCRCPQRNWKILEPAFLRVIQSVAAGSGSAGKHARRGAPCSGSCCRSGPKPAGTPAVGDDHADRPRYLIYGLTSDPATGFLSVSPAAVRALALTHSTLGPWRL